MNGINVTGFTAAAGTSPRPETALTTINTSAQPITVREATWRLLRRPEVSDATRTPHEVSPNSSENVVGERPRLPISTEGEPEMKANMQAKPQAWSSAKPTNGR